MIIPNLLFFLINSNQTSFLPSSSDSLVSCNSSLQNVCLTPGCVTAAAEVLSNLDENVDPCEDFYRFACGGWMNRHTIPEHESSVSMFTDVRDENRLKLKALLETRRLDGSEPPFVKMVKELFDACMDLEGIEESGSEPLKKNLKSLGGWPVVEGSNWNDSNFDWIQMLASFRKLGYNHNILLSLSVTADYRNNTVNIIHLDQTSLGIDRAKFLRGLNDSATAAYFKMMVQSAKLLGANEKTAEDELLKALNFEIALANFTLSREERSNSSNFNNIYTVEELQEAVPQMPWLKYFNGLLSDEIRETDTLIVRVPEFVKNVVELISRTEKRVVANYMLWRAVAQSILFLSKDWRDIDREFFSVVHGINTTSFWINPPRRGVCYAIVKANLRIAFNSYYVRQYFNKESKDAVSELVKYIQREFLNILEDNAWLDEKTKKQAKVKISTIEPYIGYSDQLLNDTVLLEIYQSLTITSESHFENMRSLEKWTFDSLFSRLRKPNIRGPEWKTHFEPTTLSAFYYDRKNSIELPAGILQNGYFNVDRPHYMNFGAIGFFIGQEIAHSFDNTGRQYDKDGNKVNWWEETSVEHFKNKTQCIIDQYSSYTAENGMKVNGVKTQDENIADNGGMKAALRAYQTWVKKNGPEQLLPGLNYSQSQLFWISAASISCEKVQPELLVRRINYGSHSPEQFRVVGPMSNLAEFAKDFHCSPKSPMNKQPKCQVW